MIMTGTNGENLNIITKVAAGNYRAFGIFLLQDENGEQVDLLEKNHSCSIDTVVQKILKTWLDNGPTRTYQYLIECLRQSGLGALADEIKKGVLNTAIACTFQY